MLLVGARQPWPADEPENVRLKADPQSIVSLASRSFSHEVQQNLPMATAAERDAAGRWWVQPLTWVRDSLRGHRSERPRAHGSHPATLRSSPSLPLNVRLWPLADPGVAPLDVRLGRRSGLKLDVGCSRCRARTLRTVGRPHS